MENSRIIDIACGAGGATRYFADRHKNSFDGALCLQTLFWLPEYEEALKNICDLGTRRIALSLLGYEGKINFNIG